MKTNTAGSAAELIRERAKVLSDIRKYEKGELEVDAWLSDPKPDAIYISNLRRLRKICDDLIRLSELSGKDENMR